VCAFEHDHAPTSRERHAQCAAARSNPLALQSSARDARHWTHAHAHRRKGAHVHANTRPRATTALTPHLAAPPPAQSSATCPRAWTGPPLTPWAASTCSLWVSNRQAVPLHAAPYARTHACSHGWMQACVRGHVRASASACMQPQLRTQARMQVHGRAHACRYAHAFASTRTCTQVKVQARVHGQMHAHMALGKAHAVRTGCACVPVCASPAPSLLSTVDSLAQRRQSQIYITAARHACADAPNPACRQHRWGRAGQAARGGHGMQRQRQRHRHGCEHSTPRQQGRRISHLRARAGGAVCQGTGGAAAGTAAEPGAEGACMRACVRAHACSLLCASSHDAHASCINAGHYPRTGAQGVDLEVQRGSLHMLLGPNGCGKVRAEPACTNRTLARCAAHCAPQPPPNSPPPPHSPPLSPRCSRCWVAWSPPAPAPSRATSPLGLCSRTRTTRCAKEGCVRALV